MNTINASDKHCNLYTESKRAILVVSYGTSSINSRDRSIGAIEAAIANALPDYEVRRAFTSQIVIDTIRQKYAEEVDNVEQALKMLINDGIEALAIQPTHILCGHEYSSLACVVERYKDKFQSVSMGAPLLTDDNDYTMLVNALADETAEYSSADTAIVFIGHGTDSEANSAYLKLQEKFTAKGRRNYFVGTLNAVPTSEEVIASVKAGRYKRVVLRPLTVTAGIHASRDIAGDKNSLKVSFEAEGFEVCCILKGIGEIKAVQNIYAAHAREAVSRLMI